MNGRFYFRRLEYAFLPGQRPSSFLCATRCHFYCRACFPYPHVHVTGGCVLCAICQTYQCTHRVVQSLIRTATGQHSHCPLRPQSTRCSSTAAFRPCLPAGLRHARHQHAVPVDARRAAGAARSAGGSNAAGRAAPFVVGHCWRAAQDEGGAQRRQGGRCQRYCQGYGRPGGAAAPHVTSF